LGTENRFATKVCKGGDAQQVMHKICIAKDKSDNANVFDVEHSLANSGKYLAISRTQDGKRGAGGTRHSDVRQ
jgi:hypothetical protein